MDASWDTYKDVLHELYIVQNKFLKDIIILMKDRHGFVKSKQQYVRKFREWDFRKNTQSDNWRVICHKVEKRQRRNKSSEVYWKGGLVPANKLKKERRHAFGYPGDFFHTDSPKTPEDFSIRTPRADNATFFRVFTDNLPSLQLFKYFATTSLKPSAIRSQFVHHGTRTRRTDDVMDLDEANRDEDYYRNHSRETWIPRQDCEVLSSTQVITVDRSHADFFGQQAHVPTSIDTYFRQILREHYPDPRLKSLFHLIYLASNNLLTDTQASEALKTVSQDQGRRLFNALISRRSPATISIARAFLPLAIEQSDLLMVTSLLNTGIDLDAPLGNFNKDGPLILATRKGDLEVIRLLLDRGADVNVTSRDRYTPLLVAVESERMELVKLLIWRYKAHVNDHPTWESLALVLAARRGNTDLVRLLLCHGANLDKQDSFESNFEERPTALQEAVSIGSLPTVQLLLKWGADHTDALPAAVRSGSMELLRHLIDLGADVDADAYDEREDFYMTALQTAALERKPQQMKLLLGAGADVNAPCDASLGFTALQAAAHTGDHQQVRVLIERGADINAFPADRGRTALEEAIRSRDVKLVRMLMESGADVNMRPASSSCMWPLETAVHTRRAEIVELILNSGVNLEDQGGPAAAKAAMRGNINILRLLLEAGVEADCYCYENDKYSGPDLVSMSAIQLAVTYSQTCHETSVRMTRLLLDHGAKDLWQALIEAVRNCKYDLIELLLRFGADVNGKSTDSDETALSAAACTSEIEMIQYLLDCGATGKSGALQVAAYRGHVPVSRALINAGADINAAPFCFWMLRRTRDYERLQATALQAAVKGGHPEVVRLLLDAGAQVEVETDPNERATALQFAAIVGDVDIVRELLERHADGNAAPRGKDGRTALEGAAEHGRLDIVQLLLNIPVDVWGTRALEFARKEGHDGIVNLLLNHLNMFQE